MQRFSWIWVEAGAAPCSLCPKPEQQAQHLCPTSSEGWEAEFITHRLETPQLRDAPDLFFWFGAGEGSIW